MNDREQTATIFWLVVIGLMALVLIILVLAGDRFENLSTESNETNAINLLENAE